MIVIRNIIIVVQKFTIKSLECFLPEASLRFTHHFYARHSHDLFISSSLFFLFGFKLSFGSELLGFIL